MGWQGLTHAASAASGGSSSTEPRAQPLELAPRALRAHRCSRCWCSSRVPPTVLQEKFNEWWRVEFARLGNKKPRTEAIVRCAEGRGPSPSPLGMLSPGTSSVLVLELAFKRVWAAAPCACEPVSRASPAPVCLPTLNSLPSPPAGVCVCLQMVHAVQRGGVGRRGAAHAQRDQAPCQGPAAKDRDPGLLQALPGQQAPHPPAQQGGWGLCTLSMVADRSCRSSRWWHASREVHAHKGAVLPCRRLSPCRRGDAVNPSATCARPRMAGGQRAGCAVLCYAVGRSAACTD